MSSKRTDVHRPGAIIPANYEYVLSYRKPGAEVWYQYNMNEVRSVCESIGWGQTTPMWGHIGKCGICGARFLEGDLWQHTVTGDYIHVGHECANKYAMLANRADFNIALAAIKRNHQAEIE